MPAVSVKYELNDNAMVYASFAKGFKAGGYSVNVSSSAFEPENVDAFEVGAKLSAFDRRLALNVAAFHSKYQDLQVSTTVTLPSGGAGTVVNNAARALSKGIEASVTARPLSGLTLRMDLAYLDSKYESYASAPCTAVQVLERPAPCRQDLSGQPTVFSPKYSGNAGFEYVAPITDAYEVKFGATAYFASEYFIFTLNDPNLMQDAYTKVDARIALRPSDGPWELALIGKNITNTKTVNYGQNASGSTGSYNMLLDPPRTVGVQLSANF